MNLTELNVSIFASATTTLPHDVTVAQILRAIHTGAYRTQIEELRALLARGNKPRYDARKKSLPAVTFAGRFSRRNGNALIQASGLFHIDLDHVPNVGEVKQAVAQDASVVFAFTSPGGDGIKAAFRIPIVCSAAQYKRLFPLIRARVLERVKLRIDEARKDISGLCFVSFDPQLYCNPHADRLAVDAALLQEEQAQRPIAARFSAPLTPAIDDAAIRRWLLWDISTAISMIAQSQPGNRNAMLLKAGRLLGGAITGYASGRFTEQDAFSALLPVCHAKNPETPRKAQHTLQDGIRYGLAAPITLAEKQARFERWKATHPLESRHAPRPPHPADDPNRRRAA